MRFGKRQPALPGGHAALYKQRGALRELQSLAGVPLTSPDWHAVKVSSIGINDMGTIARRVLAGLFAFSWLTIPDYGLTDLSSTWDPDWPQVLEGGWGLYLTVFISVPFIVNAVGRRVSRMPAVTQLYVAAAGLIVSAIPALEWQLAVLSLVIAAQIIIVAGLPSQRELGRPDHLARQPLMILTALGAVPWLAYAIEMWDLNRQERIDTTSLSDGSGSRSEVRGPSWEDMAVETRPGGTPCSLASSAVSVCP
jgi:hypothetical protein